MKTVLHVLTTAVAVWVSLLVPGVDLGAGPWLERLVTLLLVSVIIGVVNAVLQPVARTLGCLFYVLTLGLFGLLVNGLLFWLSGWLAQQAGLPFTVDGFWAAFWGALVVAVVSGLFGWLVVRPATSARRRPRPARRVR